MLHAMTFNNSFLGNIACGQFLMEQIVEAIFCMNGLINTCNTLPQQIVALKVVHVLCCVQNRR